MDELWEGNPPPSAATALRVHIARLRQVLELERDRNAPSTRLPASRSGYVLRVEPDELDAERFERLVLLAREAIASGDPARAVPQLTEALDLWRGNALADIADLSAARAEIARLDELRAVAFEELANARLTLGEHALAVDVARSAIVRYPLREQLTSTLMLALYRSGRQTDALQAYAVLVERLSELGLEPSRELRQAEADVLLQSTSLDARGARALPPAARPRTPIGRFVGRRSELTSLLQAVESGGADAPRLILVAGEAGIGKTTLIEQFCTRASREASRLISGTARPTRPPATSRSSRSSADSSKRPPSKTAPRSPPSWASSSRTSSNPDATPTRVPTGRSTGCSKRSRRRCGSSARRRGS